MNCEKCKEPIGKTKFTAVIDGTDKTLCQNCFFEHINQGKDAQKAEIMPISEEP